MSGIYVKVWLTILLTLPILSLFVALIIGNSGLQSSPDEDEKCRNRKIGFIPSILGVLLIWFISTAVLFKSADIVSIVGSFFKLSCSDSDIIRMIFCNIITFLGAIVIGFILFRYFTEENWLRQGKRKEWVLLIFVLYSIPLLFAARISSTVKNDLKITQVCRRTDISYTDSQTRESIEKKGSFVSVTNYGLLSINLGGISLINEGKDSTVVNFPEYKLLPGVSYCFEMDEKHDLDISKQGGDMVSIVTRGVRTIETVIVPALERDQVYCREMVAVESGQQMVESIRQLYTEGTAEQEQPVLTASAESGFYESEFELELMTDGPATIYYTLDGSIPNEDTYVYSGPIRVYDRSLEENKYRSIQNVRRDYLEHSLIGQTPVDKAFIIRAVAVDSEGNKSNEITETYFINLEKYAQDTVISLVVDPDDFFGEEGIYITGKEYDEWYEKYLNSSEGEKELLEQTRPTENYMLKGREAEREAVLTLFEGKTATLSQKIGVRIQGSSVRYLKVDKRLSFFSRSELSCSKWFPYELFKNVSSHSVVTREGFANAMSAELLKGRKVATLDVRPITLFLDGEYWTSTYLQEKYSAEFFAEHYDVSEENVVVIKVGKADVGEDSGENSYDKLYKYISTNDLSLSENYNKVLKMIDIDSYLDFLCSNIYLANMDEYEKKNIVMWRTIIPEGSPYADCRWRWCLYDMDLLTSYTTAESNVKTDAELDSFSVKGKWVGNAYNEQQLYVALKANPLFCKAFVINFMDLVNSVFRVDSVSEVLEKLGEDISWNDSFFENRAGYITKYMEEEFILKGEQEPVSISSNVSGTPVTLNSLTPQLDADDSWSGRYYTDYPVMLKANKVRGKQFSHWVVKTKDSENIYYDEEIEIEISKGGVSAYAIFE